MSHPLRFSIVATLLAVFAFTTQADELKTTTEKTVKGTLEKISGEGVILKDGDKSINTSMDQVLGLSLRPGRAAPAAAQYTEVRLADESVIYASKVKYGPKEVQIEMTTGAKLTVPLSAIYSVLRDAQKEDYRTQVAQINQKVSNADRVYLIKMDGKLDGIDCVLGSIDEAKQSIRFKIEGIGELEREFDKLAGIQFKRKVEANQARLCWVHDIDGNAIVAATLTYEEGKQLEVVTPYGTKLGMDLQKVAMIDFNFGKLTFLSDRTYKLTKSPWMGDFNPVQCNRDLDLNQIDLQGKKYEKGLAIYAGAQLEFDLGRKYKEFKADLGSVSRIAEEGQGDKEVTVTIFCDGKERKAFAVSTKELTSIGIDVKGVNTLRIVVGGADITGLSGHAILANAQVNQ